MTHRELIKRLAVALDIPKLPARVARSIGCLRPPYREWIESPVGKGDNSTLNRAFVWNNTEEGSYFWMMIDDELSKFSSDEDIIKAIEVVRHMVLERRLLSV